MNKIIKFAGIAAGIAMILPMAASAATVTNPLSIFGGQAQTYGTAGSSVQADFQVDVPNGQVLHAIRTKVDGQATVCTPVGPFEGAQIADVTVNVTLPPNTTAAGYSLAADLFYTDTLPQAEAMTGNLACTSSVTGSHQVSVSGLNPTPINVLPTSGGSTGTGSVSQLDQLTALVTQLAAQVSCITTGGTFADNVCTHPAPASTPNTSTVCTQLNGFLANASAGTRSQANSRLQGFLISQGISIPAIAAGASYGFDGPQTQAGVVQLETENHCN